MISSRHGLLGLMMNTQVLLPFTTFLFMIGHRVCTDLFQKMTDEGSFNDRPPNPTFNTKHKVKSKKRKGIARLLTVSDQVICQHIQATFSCRTAPPHQKSLRFAFFSTNCTDEHQWTMTLDE